MRGLECRAVAAAAFVVCLAMALPGWTQGLGGSPLRKDGRAVGSPRASAGCTGVSLVFQGSTGEQVLPPGRTTPIREGARSLCVAAGWKVKLISRDQRPPSELVGPQVVDVRGVVARGYDAVQAVRVATTTPPAPADDVARSVRRSCAAKVVGQLELGPLPRSRQVATPREAPASDLELVLMAAQTQGGSVVACGYGLSGVGRVLLTYRFGCGGAEVVARNTWQCQ